MARALRTLAFALVASFVFTACASWKLAADRGRWLLLAEDGGTPDLAAFDEALEPALHSVEELFGPFRGRVRVHALSAHDAGHDSNSSGGSGALGQSDGNTTQNVPGIGPARVRAWHLRSTGIFGSRSGIYMNEPEAGTAAHELVHARFAEMGGSLPLWLEEGIASIVGDGFLRQGTWTIDGLACWPLRELAEQRISDSELARLCALHAEEASDSRESVLVHFVGWAIAFDLLREQSGTIDWQAWVARYGKGIDTQEARERLERTLQRSTVDEWLARLADPRPEVRMATAKGLWKLRSERVLARLLDALEVEKDPEAQVALSINALAAAGEMPLAPELLTRVWRTVSPRLRRAHLEDEHEAEAVGQLMRSFRYGAQRAAQGPLEALRRFWAE